MNIRLLILTSLFTYLLPFIAFGEDKTISTKDISVIYDKVEKHSYVNGKDSIFYQKLNNLKSKLDNYITENEYNDTIVKAYVFYAYGIRFKEPVKSLKIAQELIDIVNENRIVAAKSDVMHLLASLYYSQGLINEALKIYINSSRGFKEKNDIIGYAYALIDIGNVYFKINDFENAYVYYKNAESEFNRYKGDKRNKFYGVAVCQNNYGLIKFENNKYDEALKEFRIAYKLRKENNLTSVIPHSMYYIGNTFFELGNIDSSEHYFKKAINISIKNNIENEIPVSFYKYGEYLAKTNSDSSVYYLKKAMNIADNIKEVEIEMLCREALGNYYIDKNIDSAEVYFKELFNLANEINNIDFIIISAKKLMNIYEAKTDYKNKSKFTDIVNDQLEKQVKNNILKAQFILEHNKWAEKNTELQNESTKQKSRFIYLLIFSILIISFTVILLYNRKRIKQKSKELEEKNRELKNVIDKRNTLYTIIAHDLKGPLGSGIKLIELINSKDIPKEMIEGLMLNIEKTFKTTYNLLIDLLSWVNIHKESFKMEAADNFIYKTVHESEILYKEKFEEKNISLINRIDKNIKAYFDYNTVSTVVRNLISNAIKFSNSGDEIIIDAIDKGEFVKVSIKDTGVGISKNNLDKIFNENHKISTEGTNNESGSGLGLKLCKSLIGLNNGEIWVESDQGKGSTFYFTLLKQN